MRFLLILLFGFLISVEAQAYSYSDAGKEPLIDGRNGIIGGLNVKDYAKVEKYYGLMRDDVEFLSIKYDEALLSDFDKAVKAQNNQNIVRNIHRLFAAEIQRRLSIASRNLGNYQSAKVMVVKSIRFFDMISPELAKPVAEKAKAALQECLDAIGKPGVFGTGKTPANPDAYKAGFKKVVEAFAQ